MPALAGILPEEKNMLNIRKIQASDKDAYFAMAKDFYNTEAVLFPIADSHYENTFDELMRSDTYAVCYIFELDGELAGYSLLAKTYSQEAGGIVIWIDEIYVKPAFRGRGIGHSFLEFLIKNKPDEVKRFRLETERENEGAVKLYKSFGFEFFDYDQMVIDYGR